MSQEVGDGTQKPLVSFFATMTSSIMERLKEIEAEMARTQKNKATEGHLGLLKAKKAKLLAQLQEGTGSSAGKGEGFDVARSGDARIALIGFPSVGKSSMLNYLTGTKSEAAAYEFTTLTCIPGNIRYKGTKIQLLDLPGIIEGASEGKGRGKQVIAVAKSADLVVMVLDAGKEAAKNHRRILERELEAVGLRLNQKPPDGSIRRRPTGGISYTSTVPQTKMGADPERTVRKILAEYKWHNCDVLLREEVTVDQIIDMIHGSRHYVRCLYVYNKIDTVSLEDVDTLARQKHTTVCSVAEELNMDGIVERMWKELALVRVYTKRKGAAPDLRDPVILSEDRGGTTVEAFCRQIHSDLLRDFNYALVWGRSTKHSPQHCGLSHALADGDVVQIVQKTVKQLKADAKAYAERAQEAYDKYHEKKARKRDKKALKT